MKSYKITVEQVTEEGVSLLEPVLVFREEADSGWAAVEQVGYSLGSGWRLHGGDDDSPASLYQVHKKLHAERPGEFGPACTGWRSCDADF